MNIIFIFLINVFRQVAAHDGPVKTCHWIKAPNYTCLMTASWDKTLKVRKYFNLILMIELTH